MLPDYELLLVINSVASDVKGERGSNLENQRTAPDLGQMVNLVQDPSLSLSHALNAIKQGKFTQSYELAGQVAQTSLEPIERLQAEVLCGISTAYLGRLTDAESHFSTAASIAREANNKIALALVIYNLACCVHLVQGKLHLTLTDLDEAQALCSDAGMKHWGWSLLRAHVALIRGDKHRARHILYEMANDVEPATLVAGGYYFLWARLAIDEDEYEKSKEYLRLGMRIASQTGNPVLNLWLRVEQSRYYRYVNQASAAREWAEEALRLAQVYQFPYFIGIAQIELAQVAWQAKLTQDAFGLLEKASAALEPLQASHDLAYISYLKALWSNREGMPFAEQAWTEASLKLIGGGFAFILENDQEHAFHLVADWLRQGDLESRKRTELLLENLAQVPPQLLRVASLGRFAVWKGRQLIPDKAWQRRRSGELFRYLLLQPGRKAGKETIIEALWPEHDYESGNNLLHQATSSLRRILEPDLPEKFPSRYLEYEGERLFLRLPPGSLIDFEQFETNLHAAMSSRKADLIQEALRLYTGDLLPQDQFFDWTAELRTHLSELYMEGLVTLATLYLEQEDYADALDRVNQVMRLDPWNEEAALIGMKTYLQLGSAPHALRLYNHLAGTLKKDLGIVPRSDLRQLAESIQNR